VKRSTPNPTHFVLLISVLYYIFIGFDAVNSTGRVGSTLKNGDGCTCHGDHTVTDSVLVWVEGPDSVLLGGIQTYTILMTGGPAIAGGYNVAVSFGTLVPYDGESQVIANELTQSAPKTFLNDTVRWQFIYQAPSTGQSDTIFSVGNSVDVDGIPSGDQYNFGANFIVHLKDTTTDLINEEEPISFHLSQNYPNPFNPVTSIQYSVSSTQFVTMKVVDLSGREVRILVREVKHEGIYNTTFDASNLPSGIYFYSLTSGDKSITKKMLLIR